MTESRSPGSSSQRLGELLAEFDDLRRTDPNVGIGAMRERAGDAYPELQELADTLSVLHLAVEEESPVPEAFGPFRVRRELGRGAGGIVYEAEDVRSQQRVALKVMREAMSADPKSLRRFAQESAAAELADHPAIVNVHEAGEVDGRLFIAMEYLEGPSLAALIDGIRLRCGTGPSGPWLEALAAAGVGGEGEPVAEDAGREYAHRMAGLFAPVADALHVLDRASLVHRDLKPQNLLLDGRGNLKITDFGIAKLFGNTLTTSTALMGTPAYMSPEQAAGRSDAVDVRTDIYGLGASLYAALTLRPPVLVETTTEAIAAVLRQRPRALAKQHRGYARGLATVVHRCLEKDPRDRYQDPRHLAADLRRCAVGKRPTMRPVSLARRGRRSIARHPLRAGVVFVAASLLLFLSLHILTRPPAPGVASTATLQVDSIAGAEVSVNGGPFAPVPCTQEVPPGPVALVLRIQGFRDRVLEPFAVTAGQRYHRDINLFVVDDADDVAALAKLGALRAWPTAVQVDPDAKLRVRRGRRKFDVALLYPRGDVRVEDMRTFRMERGDDYDASGRVEFRRAGETLYAGPQTPGVVFEAELPDALLATLRVGDRITWGFYPADGGPPRTAECRVVSDDLEQARRRLEAELRDSRAPQRPAVRAYFRAQLLASGGLYSAALAELRAARVGGGATRALVRLEADLLMRLDGGTFAELQTTRLWQALKREQDRLGSAAPRPKGGD